MVAHDYHSEISSLEKSLAGIEAVLDVKKLEQQVEELEAKAGAPDLWNDPENAQKVTSALSRTQSTLNKVKLCVAD